MDFKNQQAQIRSQKNGWVIKFIHEIFPPANINLSEKAKEFLKNEIADTKGDYKEIFISGSRDNKNGLLMIDSMRHPYSCPDLN